MSGCNLDTPKRKALLQITLNGFRVEEKHDVLSVRASADNFAARKHALIQAILAVNDMFYLATPTVLSLFKEDVQKWLEHSDIRFVPNIQFIGKTGYIHHFDFAIPGSRAAPERIIKAIGNPNKDAALAYVTSWIDTSDQRPPSSQALAFLNTAVARLVPRFWTRLGSTTSAQCSGLRESTSPSVGNVRFAIPPSHRSARAMSRARRNARCRQTFLPNARSVQPTLKNGARSVQAAGFWSLEPAWNLPRSAALAPPVSMSKRLFTG